MASQFERMLFQRELGHLLREFQRCKDVEIRNIICEHIALMCFALVSKTD